MSKLSATTIFGRLKATGKTILNGALQVKDQITAEDTITAQNGIEVEGGTIDQYATVRAGPNADSGHLMLDADGGNVYLARDGGETRINNGRLNGSLDVSDELLYNINSLRNNNANCELVFDEGNNRFEFEDGSGNRTEALFSRIYLQDGAGWFKGRHDQLTSVGSSDHHSKYTDSDARNAVSTFGGDHDNLEGVSPSDHHSKYTDSDAQNAVNTFGGNHDNLEGVSPSDHHSKYSNSDARSAVDGMTFDNTINFNFADIDLNSEGDVNSVSNLNVSSIDSNNGTSPINVNQPMDFNSGGILVNGSEINTSSFSGSHNDLSNVDSGDHHSKYTDSDARNAVNTFSGNHDDLSGVSGSDHHSKYTDSEARSAVNTFSGNHDDLSGVSGSDHHSKTSSASELSDVSADSNSNAHHSKYTDSEARSAVNNSSVNVDQVDGFDIQKNGTDGSGIINFKT